MPPLMEDDKFDAQSDGSGGSVEALAIDLSIQRLSTDNINGLIWKTSIPPIIVNTLTALIGLGEYTLLFYYSGVNAVALHAVYQPLELMLNTYAPYAFAIATSTFVSRALSQGHANVANIYLSHFFFVIFIWGIIVPICFASPYKHLSSFLSVFKKSEDAFGYKYYLWMFIGGPIFTACSTSIQPFFKIENRTCIYTMRGLISALLQLFTTFLLLYISSMYNMAGTPGTFYYLAIAYLVTHLIIAVWMIVVFFHKSCLMIPLKGCLHFSLRRLFPINIKIIWRILLFAIPQWFFLAQIQLLIVIMNLLYGYFYTDQEVLVYKRVGYSIYARYYALASALTTSFVQGYAQIIGFNLAIKRFRRVKQSIILTLIYICVLPTVVSITLFAVSDYLTEGIQPRYATEPDWSNAFLEAIKPVTKWAFVTPPLMGPYYIVSTTSQIEGKVLLSIIMQMSRTIPALLSLIVMAFVVGDQADFTMAYPIGDFCGATLGIVLLVQYMIKYSILAKMDVKQDDDENIVDEHGDQDHDDTNSESSFDRSSEYTATVREVSTSGRFIDKDSTINASFTDGDHGGIRRKEDSSWYDEPSHNKGGADQYPESSDNWDNQPRGAGKR